MTPTYVAKRVGDEFVLVRVDPEGVLQRAGLTGLGLGLVGYGLFRKGLVGMVATAAGAAIAYSGYTGRNIFPAARKSGPCDEQASIDPAGSDPSHRAADPAADKLDEALMESFPASDPPGSLRSAG